MNENATRSVNLTLLMIVSVCLPLAGGLDAPLELDTAQERTETAPQPGSANCYGYDACRGIDAGANTSASMNLTDDFAMAGDETNTYYGLMNGTGLCSYNADAVCNDVYLLDLPMGYGFSVTVAWNGTGNDFGVGIGPADGSMTGSSAGAWGRCYAGSSGAAGYVGMSSDGEHDCPGFQYNYGGYTWPQDVQGDPVLIWVFGYEVYNQPIQDYTMNISIWTGDGGLRGDVTSPQYNILLDMPDEPASWSYQSDTFELDEGDSADLVITYCDVWCTPESSVTVTLPDGSTDNFALPDYFEGWLATYNQSGEYTVEKQDTFGDGGVGLVIGQSIGNFSGRLSVDEFTYEDSAAGHVGSTGDGSDIYAVWVPETYFANLTLHWDNSADLDLRVYTDYDPATDTLTGLIAASYYDQPEFVDLGQLGEGMLLFAEVRHYAGVSAGYSLEYQTQPGAPPPCFYQDDGAAIGEGDYTLTNDAAGGSWSPEDEANDVTGTASDNGDGTWSGAFGGMMCAGYDTADWYQITVPAGMGMWAMLEWPEGIDSNFNDTIEIEGDISFGMYMVTSSGFNSFMSSSYGFHPQAVATNESFSWANDLGVDSTVLLRLLLNDMNEDYESNYTVTFSMYNATEMPPELNCQNDAGLAPADGCLDAGNIYQDSINLSTANQSFGGYGHDEWDDYDYYKIYMPENYVMGVCVDFPGQNDIDLNIYYVNPTWGWMSFVASSYSDNPECAYSQYDDAGQDLYIRVWTDRGAGEYEVTITLLTPGLAPGDNQDDCGLAGTYPNGDAADLIYGNSWDDHTFTNESTQADLNPYDENGTVRDYWAGGICSGWIDGVWDPWDYYSIAVPEGHYVQIDYDMDPDGDGSDNSGVYNYLYMFMCQQQHLHCSWSTTPANPAYYIEQYAGYGTDELTQISGLWPVGSFHNSSGTSAAQGGVMDTPGWLYVRVGGFSASDQDYTMNITFHPLSSLEGGDQNDANSGRDAGPGFATAVMVNDHMNQTQIDTLSNESTLKWEGWSHGGIDITDLFYFEVPANHGMEMEFTCDEETNYGEACDAYWFFYGWDSTGQDFYLGAPGIGSSYTYNTSNYASPTDSIFGISAHNWYGYDDDGDGYTINVTFFTLDADGDGWLDQLEYDCGTDPNDANSTPSDLDGDGICDSLDDDIDGDGVGNDLDEMPGDPDGNADMDGDGIDDSVDPDMDGDNWTNIEEQVCLGANSMADMQANVTPTDYDGDGLCDITEESDVEHPAADTILDPDGDNDGTDDESDAFDFDECADTDTDGDGDPDSILADCTTDLVEDLDDDDDGHEDAYEILCGSDPHNQAEVPVDSTLDMSLGGYSNGQCDALDPDDDNDGYNDTDENGDPAVDENGILLDLWPYDSSEWSDADADGQGDNRDMDDDNDGWWDSCDLSDWSHAQNSSTIEGLNYFSPENGGLGDLGIAGNCPGATDAFPHDANEWLDTDGDTVGDNTDVDDDGDGWSDQDELRCYAVPSGQELDSAAVPDDNDGDGICDLVDPDDDGDGVLDLDDAFPYNSEEQADFDGDGIGDFLDDDDDGDGWSDVDEASCYAVPDNQAYDTMTVPTDNDRDGECDFNDGDDDNDGVIDLDDDFPYNYLERTEAVVTVLNPQCEGMGVYECNDDDGDGWLDSSEIACSNAGGGGNKDVASDTPSDHDGDGICDANDPDDDNDGYPDPACVNTGLGSASTLTYVECAEDDEDRFPRDSTEWFDANEDELGDNANPITLIDKVSYDPAPYLGIVAAIGAAGYGLLQMNRNAGKGAEDEAEDYTEDFEDFDFEDDETSDDDDDVEED